MKAVKRTYLNDEQDSIDSNKAYTDKSASIRRVCRKLATITSVDDIEALKMDKASGSLSPEEGCDGYDRGELEWY